MYKLYRVFFPPESLYAEAEVMHPIYSTDNVDRCTLCNRVISGQTWLSPKAVCINKKKKPDFLYGYGFNMPFLVSGKFIECYKKSNLSGVLSITPVDSVKYRSCEIEEKYFHINVERLNIAIDHNKSQISYGNEVIGEKCPLCNPINRTIDFIQSLVLDLTNYKGLDIFKIYELGDAVFVSQQFVDFCDQYSLSNLFAKNIIEGDTDLNDIFSVEELNNLFNN